MSGGQVTKDSDGTMILYRHASLSRVSQVATQMDQNHNNGDTKMNEAEFAKMVETRSRHQLVEEIRRLASRMDEGATRIEQHAQRAETEAVPADVANQAVWAMNEAENVLRNLNFSSLARQIGAYAAVTTIPSGKGE